MPANCGEKCQSFFSRLDFPGSRENWMGTRKNRESHCSRKEENWTNLHQIHTYVGMYCSVLFSHGNREANIEAETFRLISVHQKNNQSGSRGIRKDFRALLANQAMITQNVQVINLETGMECLKSTLDSLNCSVIYHQLFVYTGTNRTL